MYLSFLQRGTGRKWGGGLVFGRERNSVWSSDVLKMMRDEEAEGTLSFSLYDYLLLGVFLQ